MLVAVRSVVQRISFPTVSGKRLNFHSFCTAVLCYTKQQNLAQNLARRISVGNCPYFKIASQSFILLRAGNDANT